MILPEGAEATQHDVLATSHAIALLENRARPRPTGATNRTKLKEDARKGTNDRRYHMTEVQQREAIAAYRASVSFMDEQVGRLLDAMDRLDLWDNTVVVFTSDHGFNLGEHGSWQKMHLWEESVRVPLMIAGPGVTRPGTTSDAVVELIDLYPTLVDIGGLYHHRPALLQGESLAPMLADPARRPAAEFAYTITRDNGASLRTSRWRYSRWGDKADGANEELYDHKTDPEEIYNLARDPAHQETLEQMRRQIDAVRKSAR